MTAAEVRQTFLDFFKSKGHTIVPSAPIVVKNDPTLMFTNAGMNQFKDLFLGNEQAKYKRVADTQKCLRVSGKHNDLEEVGVDTYHHTMFEMLGNWSFGDYFKKEAIQWAWELLTKVYGLDKDRLYVTVFEGDEKEGLAFDKEAFDEWKKYISEDRILRGNKKDNFWEMSDTGPCGPCSEIHIDLRPDTERAAKPSTELVAKPSTELVAKPSTELVAKPSTELVEVDVSTSSASGASLVNNDHPQVIEIWNLVFMEFNRKADGSLEKLPAQHVDTGMGFERLVRAIEGKTSNYDTDVFVPTIKFIEQHSGIKYKDVNTSPLSLGEGQGERSDIAMRVMADHIRAICFAIADGQLPSNNGAGYVIRRILRRAVRYQYQFLNITEPFLCKLAEIIAENFKTVFPELHAQKEFVVKVIREEEQSFLRTLESGIAKLEQETEYRRTIRAFESSLNNADVKFSKFNDYQDGQNHDATFNIENNNKEKICTIWLQDNMIYGSVVQSGKTFRFNYKRILRCDYPERLLEVFPLISTFQINIEGQHAKINGEFAFELNDTFGFPIDLTQLMCKENGVTVDMAGYEIQLQKQKSRSRKATEITSEDWIVLKEEVPTKFVGYEKVKEENCYIIKYRKVKAKGKDLYQVVLDKTPFYPEGGGQIGDTGRLDNDAEELFVIDTKKENNLIIHFVDKLPEFPGATFSASVDKHKRKLTENNHSATHLLHAALRKVLGLHVQQKGSLVNDEYLRFDFSHFTAMTDDEISKVEKLVNEKVRENISLDEKVVPIDEAKKLGAMMLFGEKYGESVRVITFDEKYSRELCGGTHVKATGQIGLFKIVSEAAIAAGVRRIEAITADGAEKYVDSLQFTVHGLKNVLKSNNLVKSVEQLIAEKNELQKRLEQFENEKTSHLKNELKAKVKRQNSINVLIELVEISSAEQLKNLSFQLKNDPEFSGENLFCVLGCEFNGKPFLSVIISENLVKEKNLDAGKIVKELAKEIQGGGGGQPFYATAGGNKLEGLNAALEKAKLIF